MTGAADCDIAVDGSRAHQFVALWGAALEFCENDRVEALLLLADATAVGLNEGDFDPAAILDRVRDSFDRLHIRKYLGRPN